MYANHFMTVKFVTAAYSYTSVILGIKKLGHLRYAHICPLPFLFLSGRKNNINIRNRVHYSSVT